MSVLRELPQSYVEEMSVLRELHQSYVEEMSVLRELHQSYVEEMSVLRELHQSYVEEMSVLRELHQSYVEEMSVLRELHQSYTPSIRKFRSHVYNTNPTLLPCGKFKFWPSDRPSDLLPYQQRIQSAVQPLMEQTDYHLRGICEAFNAAQVLEIYSV